MTVGVLLVLLEKEFEISSSSKDGPVTTTLNWSYLLDLCCFLVFLDSCDLAPVDVDEFISFFSFFDSALSLVMDSTL